MTALLVAALTASAHAIGRGSEGACCTCHAVALAAGLEPMAQPQRHRSCSGCDGSRSAIAGSEGACQLGTGPAMAVAIGLSSMQLAPVAT